MLVHVIKGHGDRVELHSDPPSMCISRTAGEYMGYNNIVNLFTDIAAQLNFPLPENFRISYCKKRILYPTEITSTGRPHNYGLEVFFVDLTEANIATYV